AECAACRAEVRAESPHCGDDARSGCSLGDAFERALNERLGRQTDLARRIDDGADEAPSLGVEPLEPRILNRHLQCHEQRRNDHSLFPPTVTTELGVPNSSSLATGAAGSARHSTPFTRNA